MLPPSGAAAWHGTTLTLHSHAPPPPPPRAQAEQAEEDSETLLHMVEQLIEQKARMAAERDDIAR